MYSPKIAFALSVLKTLAYMSNGVSNGESNAGPGLEYSIVALSYRGFWTSRGRPSQKGIELDAVAALKWVLQSGAKEDMESSIVLWGQSIGAGVATNLAAKYLHQQGEIGKDKPNISGLILETPFLGIRSMLAALYPQKWLPYRYLWPFLRNWWDSETALRRVAAAGRAQRLRVLIVQAGRDEIIGVEQASSLEALCRDLNMDVERKVVAGALHTQAMARGEGREAVVSFLQRLDQSVAKSHPAP